MLKLFHVFLDYFQPVNILNTLISQMNAFLASIIAITQSLSCVRLFCDPMDCILPGSYVHGIFQARILEWVAIFSSRGSSQLRDGTHVSCISCIDSRILYHGPPRFLVSGGNTTRDMKVIAQTKYMLIERVRSCRKCSEEGVEFYLGRLHLIRTSNLSLLGTK